MLDGPDAMRDAGSRYLPKFPEESEINYEYRRKNARFTNIWRDILEGLAAKPFEKEVSLVEGTASPAIEALIDDIDGADNHMSTMASDVFFNGIAHGIDWILIDYPKVTAETLADERVIGARPYWVRVPADRLLAIYTDTIAGRETIVHARISEPDTILNDGGIEIEVERVRVLSRPIVDKDASGHPIYGPAEYAVWRREVSSASGQGAWVEEESGPIAIGIIPLVDFWTGRRKPGTQRYLPPLKDAAFAQIEHYQQETNLKSAKELTCFPMLAGNGVVPQLDANGKPERVPVGPHAVLYAPPQEMGAAGSWSFVEPNSTSLRFLAEQIESTEKQIRELGRQPLTAQSGNLTVVSALAASSKATSAVQAWALNLKDSLERALWITGLWLGEKDGDGAKVSVFTDFALDPGDEQGPVVLQAMRAAGDLSQKTLWDEMKRRGILSSEFDHDEEDDRLNDEVPGDSDSDLLASATPRTIPPETAATAVDAPPALAGSQQEVIDDD